MEPQNRTSLSDEDESYSEQVRSRYKVQTETPFILHLRSTVPTPLQQLVDEETEG